MKNCTISNNTITVDNRIVYAQDPKTDLETFLKEAYQNLNINYPKFHKMDTISKLGILTASVLFQEEQATHDPLTTGIILSSKSGCQYTDGQYIEGLNAPEANPNPTLFTYTLPSIVMGEICIKEDIKGENMYLITEELDDEFIDQLTVQMLFEKGMSQCVSGWMELESCQSYKSQFSLLYQNDFDPTPLEETQYLPEAVLNF